MGLDITLTKEIYIGGQFDTNNVKCEITRNGQPLNLIPNTLVSVNVLVVPYLVKTFNEYELDNIFTNHASSTNDEVTTCLLTTDNLRNVLEDIDTFLEEPTEETLADLGVEVYNNNEINHLIQVFSRVKEELFTEITSNSEYTVYSYNRSY